MQIADTYSVTQSVQTDRESVTQRVHADTNSLIHYTLQSLVHKNGDI